MSQALRNTGDPWVHRGSINQKEMTMRFAYINTRTYGTLMKSVPVFLTGANDKELLTDAFNKELAEHGLEPVKGQVNIGFKKKVDPYSFDISTNQPRR